MRGAGIAAGFTSLRFFVGDVVTISGPDGASTAERQVAFESTPAERKAARWANEEAPWAGRQHEALHVAILVGLGLIDKLLIWRTFPT